MLPDLRPELRLSPPIGGLLVGLAGEGGEELDALVLAGAVVAQQELHRRGGCRRLLRRPRMRITGEPAAHFSLLAFFCSLCAAVFCNGRFLAVLPR